MTKNILFYKFTLMKLYFTSNYFTWKYFLSINFGKILFIYQAA